MDGMEYRVVLDGGATVAVVPVDGSGPVGELTPVLLYSRVRERWLGWRLLGSVSAHGVGWRRPADDEVVELGGARPPLPERYRRTG